MTAVRLDVRPFWITPSEYGRKGSTWVEILTEHRISSREMATGKDLELSSEGKTRSSHFSSSLVPYGSTVRKNTMMQWSGKRVSPSAIHKLLFLVATESRVQRFQHHDDGLFLGALSPLGRRMSAKRRANATETDRGPRLGTMTIVCTVL